MNPTHAAVRAVAARSFSRFMGALDKFVVSSRENLDRKILRVVF
jgi:hypothetical protein